MPKTYHRPLGLCYGADATRAVAQGRAGRLGGSAFISFNSVEVITRDGGHVSRAMAAYGDLAGDTALARIEARRAALCGLALDRPKLMGIVNVTPDSFSDGGQTAEAESAIAHGLRLAAEGAHILDVGGESTRPGSDAVSVEGELARVIPVIASLARTGHVVSCDTRKASVMRQAAGAGAAVINDVSALQFDPESLGTVAELGCPVVLMHAQGDPRTMNERPQYDDVVLDVFDFLEQRIAACEAAGIAKAKLIVDPGIGFGKHLHHNVAVLAGLSLYHALGVPVLLGASRKKLIDHISDVPNPADRVPGSIAAALAGVAQGVQVVRVHDVGATRQALNVWRAAMHGTDKALT
jgi:dihydropteroate synthase